MDFLEEVDFLTERDDAQERLEERRRQGLIVTGPFTKHDCMKYCGDFYGLGVPQSLIDWLNGIPDSDQIHLHDDCYDLAGSVDFVQSRNGKEVSKYNICVS